MSVCRGSENELSLTKAVEDVSHHGYIQTEALKEKQRTLSALQAALSDTEKKVEAAEQEVRSKGREILVLEDELEHLQQQNTLLLHQCTSINAHNTELRFLAGKREEDARAALARFGAYRGKMEAHRAAVVVAASQTEARKELEEKRALVRALKQKKEELREDLQNPDGKNLHMAKRELDALKEEISARRGTVAETRQRLEREQDVHAQIQKDIEIQNKRYEAIVKRLRCQLSRAQAAQRQTSSDVYHMRRQLAELRTQQDSAAGGQ